MLERHSVRQNLSEELDSKPDQLSFGTNGAEEDWGLLEIWSTTLLSLTWTRTHTNRQSCDNHRGISLPVIAGKILAIVLLNCLTQHTEDGHLPETQCSFREGRGTVDMIFEARQLQEKCQEQNRDLYTGFVDLTKAFDTVSREGLWRIVEKFGCPGTFISLVRQFHDDMLA
ncbi:hypothetical protein NDU88_008225 [Pleurodeles waltl]|uniref:Reverse transcriptase domain-containing protein n=1 Tax=Pleurodeles waltl TaxID=8319 RepID=A0AAV7N5Z2_PLEWA|nr:hypothetical protein NDU88_008225 [Pleurodeles waltl]